MKKLSKTPIIWIALFVLTFSQTHAQSKKVDAEADTNDWIQVTSRFDESMKRFEGNYTVMLSKDNKVEETQVVKVKKPFKFILKKNLLYAIKIEKEGYIYKLISISTVIPPSIDVGDLFKFGYETNMIAQDLYHNFDDDDMDFPMALVSYDKKCDCFEYDKKYTAKLIERIVSKMLYGG